MRRLSPRKPMVKPLCAHCSPCPCPQTAPVDAWHPRLIGQSLDSASCHNPLVSGTSDLSHGLEHLVSKHGRHKCCLCRGCVRDAARKSGRCHRLGGGHGAITSLPRWDVTLCSGSTLWGRTMARGLEMSSDDPPQRWETSADRLDSVVRKGNGPDPIFRGSPFSLVVKTPPGGESKPAS